MKIFSLQKKHFTPLVVICMEKLHISDCAVIVCTNEQEDAVNMIVESVACIRTSNENEAV